MEQESPRPRKATLWNEKSRVQARPTSGGSCPHDLGKFQRHEAFDAVTLARCGTDLGLDCLSFG
ncbi:hypothetical protein HRbin30_00306 [bacterium HR30]|nr:hypothetical protein HRbin30_00306 [bacterium HR30]